MTRQALPNAAYRGYGVDHAAIQVNWDQLETAPGAYDGGGWAAIDTALRPDAGVVGIRLRILGGVHAPDYVKQLNHAPVSGSVAYPDGGSLAIDCASGGIAIYNPNDGVGGCAPFWWISPTDGGLDPVSAYQNLMAEVARRYDAPSVPVFEVVDSACMTTYAEPFYRAHSDKGTNARLSDAGLTYDLDRTCFLRSFAIHAQLFPHTRTSLAINAWDLVDPLPDGGVYRSSFSATAEVLDAGIALLGDRLVLQNNSLGESDGCSGTATSEVFCYLGAYAGPKGFQTETFVRLDVGPDAGGSPIGLLRADDHGIALGADFIELPSGISGADAGALLDQDGELRANAAACAACGP